MMAWLPYVVIALLVLAMIVLVVVIVRAGGFGRLRARASKTEAEVARLPAEIAPPAGLSTAIAIAMRELRVLVAGGRGPVDVPWTLVVGAGGPALAALLPPPMEAQHEIRWTDETRLENAGTVSFRTGGVVVGFEDGLVDGPRPERRLGELLRAVEIVRPDRPIDSIAIVVPWRQLASPAGDGRESIVAYGRRLYQILLTAQQRTGWRVPVYLLLADCEQIPGFAAYARAALRAEHPAIGWPAPNPLDSVFEVGWVDDAFQALDRTLSAQQLHLMMGLEDRAAIEDVLLFPRRLGAIQPALTLMLDEMMQRSAYHEGFMLRGVFVTGEMAQAAGSAEDVVATEAAPLAIAAASAHPSVLAYPGALPEPAPIVVLPSPAPDRAPQPLAQTVFLTKIFAESQLAQPAYGEKTRRHRMLRRTRLALALAVALFVLGLAGIRYQNERRMGPVRDLLQDIIDVEVAVTTLRTAGRDPETGGCDVGAAALPQRPRGSDLGEKRAASITLLDRMSELDVNRVATLLAPTSFLAHSDAHIEEAIRTSFRDVVFHAISESMSTPAGITALIGHGAPDATADSYWPVTVRNVVEYDANYRIARSLEKRSGEDAALVSNFAALVRYALSQELPAGFQRNYQLYANGIAHYAVPCIASDDARETLRREVTRRYGIVVDRIYLDNPLSQAASVLVAQDMGAARGESGGASLETLVAAIDAVDAPLAVPGRYDWVYAETPGALKMPDVGPLAGLQVIDVATVADLPRDVRTRAFAEAVRLREAQVFGVPLLARGSAAPDALAPAPGAAPVAAPVAATPGVRLSQGMVDTRAFLRALFAQPFMNDAPVASSPYPGAGWNYAHLRAAGEAVKAYDGFVGTPSGEMPAELRERALAEARQRFGMRIAAVVAQATPSSSMPSSAASGSDADATAFAFAQALPMLVALRNSLLEADVGGAAAELDAKVAGRAGQLLAIADAQLNSAGGPYAVDQVGLATWRGTTPLAPAVFGVASGEELEASLPLRRASVAGIAQSRAALVDYLRDPGTAASPAAAARAARWKSILDTLRTYDAGSPNNTLTRLERFMTVDIDRQQRECARIRGARGSTDYFAAQQAAIAARIAARCGAVASSGARTQFDRLRDAFNTTLAGRFPFGDPQAPPADPGAVQRFFAEFGDALDPLRAQIEAERTGAGAGAAAALARLQEVQAALAPMLAAPGPLTYSVQVAFLTDPMLARGQRQIVEARIGSTPADQARTPHGPPSFGWTNGQPIGLALRWALNAPSVPVEALNTDGDPAAAGRCVPPPGGGVATVRVAGTWALLRLIEQHRPAPIEGAVPSEDGVPVAFDVPLCANLQRAAGGDDRPGPARVFLRLALSATIRAPDKPDRQVPVTLPVFPRSIPALARDALP